MLLDHKIHRIGRVVSIYDGDTFTANLTTAPIHLTKIDYIQYGRNNVKLRLFGIDTPEVIGVNKSKGILVRNYVRLLISNCFCIGVELIGKGKYGRDLCNVYLLKDTWSLYDILTKGLCLNKHLFNLGLAIEMNSKGQRLINGTIIDKEFSKSYWKNKEINIPSLPKSVPTAKDL